MAVFLPEKNNVKIKQTVVLWNSFSVIGIIK